jgi:hypothetical protein
MSRRQSCGNVLVLINNACGLNMSGIAIAADLSPQTGG